MTARLSPAEALGVIDRADDHLSFIAACPLPENGRPRGTPGHSGIRSVKEILADPELSAPPRPVAPRLAWAGRSTLLAAREKAGKSTLASGAAAAVSTGRRFLGEDTTPGPVLWVGLEEALGDTANRLADFGCDQDAVFLVDRVGEPLAELHVAIATTGPILVVVDTLATFVAVLGLDPGSSSAWTPVMSELTRTARDSGAALLLLHHARKSDGRYRDSSAIGAGVDVILEMDEGDGGWVRKIRGRGRWRVDDCAVRLADDRWELAAGELSLDARVLLFVENNPGASSRAVRGGVQGKAREIDATVERLLERGAVLDTGGPTGHQYEIGRDTIGTRGGVP